MAVADDTGKCAGPLSQQGCWETKNGKIVVGLENRVHSPSHRGDAGSGRQRADFSALQMGAAFCADASADAAASGGTSPEIAALCRGFAALVVAPSRDQILRAFRELPLYRGAIRTDPAVFTLVNLETYFWCGDSAGRGCATIGEGERIITLLGQQVRIRPRIVSYAWDFGDGAGQRVTGGRAAHTYRHADPVTVTVTLTWTADYALGGGAFQPIEDTTTTTSPPRTLPVREAQAIIVGGD
jgi:hypothetical protein